jgi:hypothetical protein
MSVNQLLYSPHGGIPMQSRCATCPMRLNAEKKPQSLVSRIWRWHTGWCPGWKAYQAELAQQEAADKA